MIEGITTRRVESTPAQDPTLGTASRQQQDQRGEKQSGAASFGDTLTLSTEAQQQLSKLQQRDREVRSHEQAHISAGGQHVTGGASYSYTKGPDGRQYAIGGSVSIDTAPIAGDPEATEEKARMVRSAALAPGQPSAQDQNVAAQAASMEMQAQTEKRTQGEDGQSGDAMRTGAGAGAEESTDKDGGRKGRHNAASPLAVEGEKPLTPAEALRTAEQQDKTDGAKSTDGADSADGLERASTGISSPNSAIDRASADKAEEAATSASRATGGTPVAPASGTDTSANTGFLFGAMEVQARSDKVAALYQAQQDKFIPPTALAPNGTGISHRV